ncbi:hypothetical protein PG996_004690 [Apiospora saccharicola]|uniref:AA1-like domain-containing protein n=1 Tax=Apiospora saccharicola TaxID=335842 RepID=A0ABR1W4T7_9PEZI
MKCYSTLLLLVLSSISSAAPTSAPNDFTIVNLYAEVVPHSSSSRTSSNAIATSCVATPQTESNGELVNVTQTPCADDGYTWAWTIVTSPDSSQSNTEADTTNTTCNIEYWFEGSSYSLYALHPVPANQIVWTNQQSPTGSVQAYAGPANFTVPVASVY